MKFTVEVDEFWLEEEELAEALQDHVKRSVISDVSKRIEERVNIQITKKLNEVIDHKLSAVIDMTLTKLIDTQIIIVNREEISIVDHIKNIFQKSHGWSNYQDQMERIAKKFGDELKIQYNNAFANKVVSNMKEQGLLKDEVVQILLEGKQK